jgi:replicative superfamily II helicase
MATLDFSKLGHGASADTLLDPQEIFAALPGRSYSHLRAVQSEVLDAWFPRRHEPDLAVKANTGGGKTTIGLLIAKPSLNEKVAPALYVTPPDGYLVEQVVTEAGRLGVAATTDIKSPDFLSGKAVGVATLRKLFNGQSLFGAEGGWRATRSLGTVIIDDAHTSLTAVEGQFRLVFKADGRPTAGADPLKLTHHHLVCVGMLHCYTSGLKVHRGR